MGRRAVAWVLFGCAAVLIPWTLYLGISLPAVVAGRHVRDFWVIYDSVLAAGFATTGWLTLRGQRRAAAAAGATAVLLVIDACLDLSWSHSGLHFTMAVLRAFLLEIPTVTLLLYTVRLATLQAANAARAVQRGPVFRRSVHITCTDRFPHDGSHRERYAVSSTGEAG